LDTQILKFIHSIQEMSDSETTFIITSDHGENLGYPDDDYLIEHTASLSEGLLHVPFDIINPPSEAHSDNSLFSLTMLPHFVEKMQSGEDISISGTRYIEAELIGSGLLNDPDDYWDRMIRAVYDNKTQTKVTWDSLGNAYRCSIDGPSSSRSKQVTIDSVPHWATNRFQTEITKYKRQAKEEKTNDLDLQAGTKDRLEDLGYL
jgi:hypothetical protein